MDPSTPNEPRRRRWIRGDVATRFWARVIKGPSCWLFDGATDRAGYGRMNLCNGKFTSAHRVSYEIVFGAVPAGFEVCHRCDNPRCVRPDHLFLGSHEDNMRDMARKGRANNQFMQRTECAKGHPYTPDNTEWTPLGTRKCRSCRRADSRRYKQRRAEREGRDIKHRATRAHAGPQPVTSSPDRQFAMAHKQTCPDWERIVADYHTRNASDVPARKRA